MVRLLLALSLIVTTAMPVLSRSLDAYIKEAEKASMAGDLDKAVEIMGKALAEYPDSSTAYAYMGIYKGRQAGSTENFLKAGALSTESFHFLDKAIELDPNNLMAHLFRGIMGIKVPSFLGKLDEGISDLEFVVKAYESSPNETRKDLAIQAYQMLAEAYRKKGDSDLASEMEAKSLALSSGEEGTAQGQPAKGESPVQTEELSISELEEKVKDDPQNVQLLTDLGKAYSDSGNYAHAEEILRRAISIDSTYAPTYKYLGSVLSLSMREQIYDERIHQDTDWAAKRAFEIMRVLDKAVELSPDDVEVRFLRGVMGVNLPFFVGKLEQGIADLESVYEGESPPELKAQAAYYLGIGYQRKAMTYWRKVISNYGDLPISKMVLEAMRPRIEKPELSTYTRPFVFIDFIIGFKDELAPQIAVWVETEAGDFVRTIYVSGFSGYAREVQVVLPVWAATSKFIDADAVTGASIDLGEHTYTWDLTDANGERVPEGSYVIKVEATFWPSNKYQIIAAPIKVDSEQDRTVVREGDFVPYLEVSYLP